MKEQTYATLAEMQEWAVDIFATRRPDYVIGDNYLRRWHIAPRNAFTNVYLHWFGRSDDDRAFHDHPWPNSSFIISGSYLEHTPEGVFLRKPGDFIERPATALHRIELIDNQPAVSLFTTGPKIREWGFATKGGWVPWQEFCALGDMGHAE